MTLDKKDTQALAVDALSQPWNFKFLYAFPPSTLVPVVVNKLKDATGSALLDGCPLVTHADGAPVRHPSPSAAGAGSPDQRGDGLPSQQAGQTPSSSMAVMRQATGVDLQQPTFTLLECSWRSSTRKQYQSAWSTWEQWCASQSVDTTTVTVEKLLTYLQHLFSRGLAWRSLNVHRSAISSILETHKPTPIGQHPLVCRFLKGVFNRRPPPVCLTPTWDIGQVLMYIAQWHPAESLSLPRLTSKITFMLAAFTAKRVSDLVLFSVDGSLCHVGSSCVVLQTAFESKTDRPSHRSPPVKLKKCEDERLCPVRYITEYIQRTETLSRDSQLLISPYTLKAVKLATVRHWIHKVLQEAGVSATPGSTRATATSCAFLQGVSLQQLMSAADWSRRDTPFRHYLRTLPEDTVRRVTEKDVQDAVLSL